MLFEVSIGILLPFLGTTLGAACVFFMRKTLNDLVKKAICGFAGGVMIAASVWSLLIPSLEYESSKALGFLSFLPALVGLWLGVVFLLAIDKILPEPSINDSPYQLSKNRMLIWSVSLHNLPEGMAVGIIYAAMISSRTYENLSGAFALSLGIAIQNFPEGAIVSTPLASDGMKKGKAFLYGFASGIIELLGALITILALSVVIPLLPYLLGFAAGAMIYAVIKELTPIIVQDESSNVGILFFTLGFSFMMMLDVALG